MREERAQQRAEHDLDCGFCFNDLVWDDCESLRHAIEKDVDEQERAEMIAKSPFDQERQKPVSRENWRAFVGKKEKRTMKILPAKRKFGNMTAAAIIYLFVRADRQLKRLRGKVKK